MSQEIFRVLFAFGIIARSMSYLNGNDLENLSPIPCSTDDFSDGSYMGVRNGIIDEKFRWKELRVYVDPSYNYKYVRQIASAINSLKKALPCLPITLLPQNGIIYGDYVHILDNGKCSSNIGRVGERQIISLANPGCMSKGIIIHELLHALGFRHEHSRPDRDEYVEIHYENIMPGHEHNFRKVNPDHYTSFNVPYNEQSIMHYQSTLFSKNHEPTITSKRNLSVGSLGYMQETDVEKLRRMYNCKSLIL